MLYWITRMFPLLFLLVLAGNCKCDNYEVLPPEHTYDPVRAAKADAAIAALNAKVAELEEKLANQQPNGYPINGDLADFAERLNTLAQKIAQLEQNGNNQADLIELQNGLNDLKKLVENSIADLRQKNLSQEDIEKLLKKRLQAMDAKIVQVAAVATQAEQRANTAQTDAYDAQTIAKQASDQAQQAFEDAKKETDAIKDQAALAKQASDQAQQAFEDAKKETDAIKNQAALAKQASDQAQQAFEDAKKDMQKSAESIEDLKKNKEAETNDFLTNKYPKIIAAIESLKDQLAEVAANIPQNSSTKNPENKKGFFEGIFGKKT